MKIFITGASGFVGTQLTSFLIHIHGDSVVALSRSAASDEKIRKAAEEIPTKGWPPGGAQPSPGRVEIVRGDVSSREALAEGKLLYPFKEALCKWSSGPAIYL